MTVMPRHKAFGCKFIKGLVMKPTAPANYDGDAVELTRLEKPKST